MFYASRDLELEALRRAARRVGCSVERWALEAVDGAPGVRAELECPDGWAAARLLLALAVEDSETPGARELSAALRGASGGSDVAFARAIHSYVRDRVAFRRELGEVFQSPAITLRRGWGDCDCQFRLAYALARAGGLRASMGLLHDGRAFGAAGWPSHVAPIVHPAGGDAAWIETTVAARYGEHPMVAARRLGLGSRDDLSKEGLQVMSEDDLPPVPEGFDARNPIGRVELDAEALARLGYLEAGACPMAASDPAFRRSVLMFQRDRGLREQDGLIGAETRAAIDRALREAGPPVNQAFPYLGAVAERPKRVLTAHLSDRFFAAVIVLALELRALGAKIGAADLLAVWLAESGIRADLPNGAGAPFYGLNQLGLPMHARMVGWLGTAADYLGLDAADQVPFVGRYYKGIGAPSRLVDAGSLYLANFLPAFLAHSGEPDFVLADRENDVHGWYKWNAGLDVDRDGKIQVRDLAAAVEAAKRARAPYWAEVLARLEAVEQHGPDDPPSVGGVLGVVGGIVALVGAGAWAVSRVLA